MFSRKTVQVKIDCFLCGFMSDEMEKPIVIDKATKLLKDEPSETTN